MGRGNRDTLNRRKFLKSAAATSMAALVAGDASAMAAPSHARGKLRPMRFVRYLRQPSGQMPPYTSKITSDGELADIYAFLQSLPQPPNVRSIPLLDPSAVPEKRR